MALTPDADQFSQFLRLAFLRSPNYTAGVSGWTINQDGSAELNNVTVRGTVTASRFVGTGIGLEFVIYSGTPAAGNVLCSAISSAATDSFGNALLQDFAVYGQVGSPLTAMRIQETGISYYTATSQAGPWSIVSSINYLTAAPAHLSVGGGVSRLDLNSTEIRAYANVEAAPAGTLETWHTIAPVAGFSAGSPTPRYQLEPINGGRVRLSGVVNLTANQVAGTTFFTLPPTYIPAQNHFFAAYNSLSGYTAGGKSVQVNSAGQIQVGSGGSNGNFMQLDGIVFELD